MPKVENSRNVLIVAGEASGDILGGLFIRSVKSIQPDYSFWGIGGKTMLAEGMEQIYSAEDLGVTGFTEVLSKLPIILQVMKRTISQATHRKPTAAVLIDYPDFNMRLSRRLKKIGIPVVYYVSPQMWAWRPGRVESVRKYVERMMVLFPFEESWYKDRGVDARFVGNPVLDRIASIGTRDVCRRQLGVAENQRLIAILPGSRMNEVSRNLPVLLRSVQALIELHHFSESGGKCRFLLPLADTIPLDALISEYSLDQYPIEVVSGSTLSILRAADFAWVTSGTAALETALLGTPHVVVYRMNPMSFLLARHLVKIPFISIANLMVGKALIPELVQNDFCVERLIEETVSILDNPDRYQSIVSALRDMREKFGGLGASDRAAAVFLESVAGHECGENP